MSNGTRPSSRLADYLYKLEDVRHIASPVPPLRHDEAVHGLLLINEAAGDIIIDGRSYSLRPRQIFVLCPGSYVRLYALPDAPADYYYIRFAALEADGSGRYAAATLDCPDEISTSYFPFVEGMVQEMDKKRRAGGWEAMRASVIFQEIIIALFQEAAEERESDVGQAIKLTVDYMEQNYQLDISRHRLAELAGLNADYYSRAFKKRTGKSPMEYLAGIRMKEAKRLLLRSGSSFRAIAHSVGFSDEFYFSRRFKAEVGCSPAAYVKNMKRAGKIASLNHLTTGHLIALDIEPYAAVISSAYPVAARLRHTIAVGRSNPDLEKLMAAGPDLIVASGTRHGEKTAKERMFDEIAPTITLPFFSDWRDHFRTIAGIVGREKAASDWLERYERKADAVRLEVKRQLGGESVLVVGIGDGELCVYGMRNMGTVLYGDLQLAVPPGVTDIRHYREVSLDELAAWDPERIVLTSYRHDGSAYMDRAIVREARMLERDRRWQALKAVREGKVLRLYDSGHLYTSYNALSHDLLLDKARQLLLAGPERADG